MRQVQYDGHSMLWVDVLRAAAFELQLVTTCLRPPDKGEGFAGKNSCTSQKVSWQPYCRLSTGLELKAKAIGYCMRLLE